MNSQNIRRLVSIVLIVILAIFFEVAAGGFFTSRNLLALLRDAAYMGLVALGTCFVIVGGGVDLSGTGMLCFVGFAVARLSYINNMPGIVVLLAGVSIGVICGFVNAVISIKLRLSEFVTTVATGLVYAGMALLIAFRENGRITSRAITNESFLVFGRSINGLFYITIAWFLLVIIMQYVMKMTKLGMYTVALGSNYKAASMSGVNCNRLKTVGFIIGGAFIGIAAAFVVSYQSGTNMSFGSGMAFNAVAACVVGGVVLGGGKGDPVASFLGALIMTMITNGLYKLGLTIGGTYVTQGVIIIVAMNLDTQINRMSHKRLGKSELL